MSAENPLHEQPIEFASSIATASGSCDAQSILPVGDHHSCICSCGRWTYEAGDVEEGLRRVRAHTAQIDS